MKYFRMSYEEVVFNRSYANIMLLNKAIPTYNSDDKSIDEEGVEEIHTAPNAQHAGAFFQQFM